MSRPRRLLHISGINNPGAEFEARLQLFSGKFLVIAGRISKASDWETEVALTPKKTSRNSSCTLAPTPISAGALQTLEISKVGRVGLHARRGG